MRTAIVQEARSWINTRYHHQAMVKGVGTDCFGLVYGTGYNLGLLPVRTGNPAIAHFEGYTSGDKVLRPACDALFSPISTETLQSGDICLMQFRHDVLHIGIIGNHPKGELSIIHAFAPRGRVVESRLDANGMKRIVAAYLFPGV